MSASTRVPKISTVGIVSWDEIFVLDRYPHEGHFSHISETYSGPGGTTGNIAMAAARSDTRMET